MSVSSQGEYFVWDVAQGKKLAALSTLRADKIHFDIIWSSDGKRVMSSEYSNYVKVWSADTGETLMTFMLLNYGKDWLAVTPQGYHDGSVGGRKLLQWRVPGPPGEFPTILDGLQMEKDYRKPELFRHLLAEGNVERALKKAEAEGKKE